MKRYLVLLLLFAPVTLPSKNTLGKQNLLEKPSDSETSRIETVENKATEWWFHNCGILAEESLKVSGHFISARKMQGFAEKGDKIWEVRVVYLGTTPTGVIWINDRTESVLAIGPDLNDKTEPVAGGDATR